MILLLSPFFYPEPISTGKYNTVLAQGLVARGEDVRVFASHPLYPNWHPVVSAAQLSGVKTVRGGGWLRYPGATTLRRLLLEFWYAVFAYLQYIRMPVKPNYVVPVFPPSLFFLGVSLLLPRSAKVVGIVHDLQGVYAKQSASVLGRILQVGIHAVEARCFAKCHRLIFLSKSMAELAIAQYGLDRRACIVRYPFVALSAAKSEIGDALLTVLPLGFTHIVYSGALGDKQNPDGLLEFMQLLARHNTDFRCHVFSSGPHFERIKALYIYRGDSGVEFHDLVPSEQLDELYARSSVQLIPQAIGTSDGSLPSKLPNLIAAGVPIFAICEAQSELGYLVNEANAGVVSEGWDPDTLISKFQVLANSLNSDSRVGRISRQKAFLAENFSVDTVIDAILSA